MIEIHEEKFEKARINGIDRFELSKKIFYVNLN